MMLTEGTNRTRDLFSTDTDRGQFGTGTTGETVADTTLETPVTNTLVSTTSSTASQFLIKTTEINSLLAVGSTLSESGLIDSTDSTLMNRATFTGLAKTNLFQFRSRKRFYFK